jgi:hypothetical protein
MHESKIIIRALIRPTTACGILKIEDTKSVLAAEDDLGSQAGDVLVVFGVDVGVDGVFALDMISVTYSAL